ncbi:hypothetical protein M758_2G116700 [Ceratodon purpureus]|nr:hypothetical protein M758_2G116700 [Ceratodon purpureus]
MENRRGKVILFGRTGAGKSTVSNALVTGSIDGDLKFKIGHGVKGCTSEMTSADGRGWTVTDTVGLGEGQDGQVEDKTAEQKICDFLKQVQGKYSHVIYVKSSKNRMDVIDETIWLTFLRVFKGAEAAFTILFTKGDEKWLADNWDKLPSWVQELGRHNVLITDIPPVAPRPVQEKRNQQTRRASIEKLDTDLWNLFQSRGGQYEVPDICNMNDAQLVEESSSILAYVSNLFSSLLQGLTITATAITSFNTILTIFTCF